MYNHNYGINTIAKKLSISYGNVRTILKKYNLIRTDDWQKGCKGIKNGKFGIPVSDSQLNKFYISKTGLSFDEYVKRFPSYIAYQKKVFYFTKRNDLSKLKYIEKRGKTGQKDSYHLDHKYSIIEGFKNNINPELIGNIVNLEMIPWIDNIRKASSCSITIDELFKLTNNTIPIKLIN